MKKTVIAFVMGAVLATAGSAYADDIKSLVGKSVQDEVVVKVEGALLDKKAVVIDGSSYLPVRAIGDALDMDVSYSAKTGVELTLKEATKVEEPQTETPVEQPKAMTQDDVDAIKSSEEQIAISEKRIIEYTDKLKTLGEELKDAELKLSQTTDVYDKQTAEMKVSGVKQTIEGTNQLLQVAKDNIPAQQAYIAKIKAKYE